MICCRIAKMEMLTLIYVLVLSEVFEHWIIFGFAKRLYYEEQERDSIVYIKLEVCRNKLQHM